MNKEVLLLGANHRAMFCWAKQFSIRGYRVSVFDSEEIPLEKSKYIDKYFKVDFREEDVERYFEALLKIIQSYKFQYLLPVNDLALEIIDKFRLELEKHISLFATPQKEQYAFCHNKYLLVEQCLKSEVPAPKTYLIEKPGQFTEYGEFDYPVILKPVNSRKIIHNRIVTFNVQKASNQKELENILISYKEEIPLMIQEFITGEEVGYNFLADKGRVLLSYFDKQNKGYFGSESSQRETIHLSNEIQKKMDGLIEKLGWTGPGMFDILLTEDKPYILEMNGRLWASAELGVLAGCNIPGVCIDYFLLNKPFKKCEVKTGLILQNNRLSISYTFRKFKTDKNLFKFLSAIFQIFTSGLDSKVYIEDSIFCDFRFRIADYFASILRVLKRMF